MSKKLLLSFSVLLILLLAALVTFTFTKQPISVQKTGTGKLFHAGKIQVVVLSGSYHDMGRQYGALLKDTLNKNYQGIIKGLKDIPELTEEDLQEYGDIIYRTYPQKYKQIIQGLAETSGLGLKKAILLNAQEIYVNEALMVYAKKLLNAGKCSGFAAWGDYTSNGALVFGRNYDLGPFNARYVTVTVLNPIDGSLSTANITYAGAIYATSGINQDSLFLELNNGSASDPTNLAGKRAFAPVSLLNMLEKSKDLAELSRYMETTSPDMSYIINAADKNGAYSFEWATYGVRRRGPDKNGLLAATNCFFDPGWKKPLPDLKNDPDMTYRRYLNLLALGEKYKGKIDPKVMMKIMATPREKGGVFVAPNFTSYQLVVVPARLTMWVRIPQYQNWTEIDLAPLFDKKQ